MDGIAAWLQPLDLLSLECDGLSRAVATLLRREGIERRLCVGALTVTSAGTIDPHFWVELACGAVCDYRARMWLGNMPAVPHGVFLPDDACQYSMRGQIDGTLQPAVFHALTGMELASYPAYVPGHPMEP